MSIVYFIKISVYGPRYNCTFCASRTRTGTSGLADKYNGAFRAGSEMCFEQFGRVVQSQWKRPRRYTEKNAKKWNTANRRVDDLTVAYGASRNRTIRAATPSRKTVNMNNISNYSNNCFIDVCSAFRGGAHSMYTMRRSRIRVVCY